MPELIRFAIGGLGVAIAAFNAIWLAIVIRAMNAAASTPWIGLEDLDAVLWVVVVLLGLGCATGLSMAVAAIGARLYHEEEN